MEASIPTRRGSVAVAYLLFILVGLSTGVSGVLLVAQMDDYQVGRASIGLMFFTFSAGFVLAGATAGPLIHRWGTRLALLSGAVAFAAAGLAVATRPAFWLFLSLQIVAGYGCGMLESVLNAYLAAMPRSTTLLNRLHAFFGVGALIGPAAAAWLVRYTSWPMVVLAVTLFGLPAFVAAWFSYPNRATDPLVVPARPAGGTPGSTAAGATPAGAEAAAAGSTVEPAATQEPGLLAAVLRSPAVLLGAVLLTVYVGLEISVGNWGFAFLIEHRSAADTVASATISGYWLGLTVGRFVLSPLVQRMGLTKIGLLYVSIFGVIAMATLGWLAPTMGVAAVGFVLLGFFLGPVFPTIMAVAPDLTSARLAPTAIGVINAGSVVGGSGLPWLAGALGQGVGVWTLLPFALVLAVVQLIVLWLMVAQMNPSAAAVRVAPSEARP